MRCAEDGPLAVWGARPPELLRRPRRVEPLRAGRNGRNTRQATAQQTMPGSVRQPTAPHPTPPTDLEALTPGLLSRLAEGRWRAWIPACAGMTSSGIVHSVFCPILRMNTGHPHNKMSFPRRRESIFIGVGGVNNESDRGLKTKKPLRRKGFDVGGCPGRAQMPMML